MRPVVVLTGVTVAFVLILASTVSYAQVIVNIPFKFDAGGQSFPPGEYSISQGGGDKPLTLRAEPKGSETSITIVKKLAQPNPPIQVPQLVFDMVGDFEPSYTEYITDYLLAEVWLPGQDGLLVLAGNRAPQHQTVKGERSRK